MEIKGGDYDSVKNMIWKLALERYHKECKKRPDLEFDDILGEAMCIYSTCLTTYKESKGMKFSTYLYQNLYQRLIDYTMFTMRKYTHYEDFNIVGKDGSMKQYEETIVSPEYDINNEELLASAKDELSYEAFQVLKYILSREWEGPRQKQKPTDAYLAKHFGYSLDLVKSVMYEIKRFWNNVGWQVA
jgi:DNA-directed RNA polymerase specialized sigma subunit